MKVLLNRDYLAGALEACPKNNIRYYLNGVCVDFVNQSEIVIVATDGNIMFAANSRPEFEDRGDFIGQIIIPRDVIAQAVKTKEAFTTLSINDSVYILGNILFTPIEGKFPDYVRVIPQSVNGEPGNYDIDLLKRAFDSVSKANLTKKTVNTLFQNGTLLPGVVQGENAAVMCVIMPRRENKHNFMAWVQPVADGVK